jgi:16S rRNA (guanine966-N2)-methyltransferase
MRITGGLLRGRVLAAPKGMRIRPTSDRVREAIFDLVGHDLSGFRVLDLFAGTGSLGIEALSRGASSAVFVDGSPQSLDLIRRNIALCGLEERTLVVKRDLKKGLPLGDPRFQVSFALIFIDPPYGRGLIPPLLEELVASKCIDRGSWVVVETGKAEELPESVHHLNSADSRVYGDTKISLYTL